MRTKMRHLVRLLSDIKRARECRTLRAVATRNTMRLATEEAAAEPASQKDVQRDRVAPLVDGNLPPARSQSRLSAELEVCVRGR